MERTMILFLLVLAVLACAAGIFLVLRARRTTPASPEVPAQTDPTSEPEAPPTKAAPLPALTEKLTAFLALLENPALAQSGRIELTRAGEESLALLCYVAPKGLLLEAMMGGPRQSSPAQQAALLEEGFPPLLLRKEMIFAPFNGRELMMTTSLPWPGDQEGHFALGLAAQLAPVFPGCRVSHTRDSVVLRLRSAQGKAAEWHKIDQQDNFSSGKGAKAQGS
jgi:hypothetical protein